VALLPTEEQETSEEGTPSLDRAWALTLARLQTIPGIGFLTALWIVVTTMNFSLCSSAEPAAAYAAAGSYATGIRHEHTQASL